MSGPAPDPLGPALLPVVMHRLNNATQLLTALNAVVGGGGGEAFLASRADDLAHASRTTDALGFALAVLASAAGHDLLLARRDPRALSVFAELVGEALGREGHALGACEGEPCVLEGDLGRGWEFPWAFGALLLAAGRAASAPPGYAATRAQDGRLAVTLRGVTAEAWSALEPAVAARGVTLEAEQQGDDAHLLLGLDGS